MKVLPFAGIKTAPKTVSESAAEQTAYNILAEHHEEGGLTQAQADRTSLINRLASDKRNREPDAMANIHAAVKAGKIELTDVPSVLRRANQPAGLKGLVRDTKLQPEDLMKVWDAATPAERKDIAFVVRGRIGNSKAKPADKRAMFDKITADTKASAQ
jgi:hypothetical protein